MLPAAEYPVAVLPVQTESGPLAIQWGPATKKSPFTAVVSFEVLRGPYAGETISAFLYFSDGTIARSLEYLRLCGFTGDDIDKFSDQSPSNEVSVTVVHEEYDGKVRAKVAWINDPARTGGLVLSGDKKLAPSEMRKFSAALKGRLKSVPAVQGKKAEREAPTGEKPPAATEAPAERTSDEWGSFP